MSRGYDYGVSVHGVVRIRVKITRCIDVVLEVHGCSQLVETIGLLVDKCRGIGGKIYVHRISVEKREPRDEGLLCSIDVKEVQPHMLQRCCPP